MKSSRQKGRPKRQNANQGASNPFDVYGDSGAPPPSSTTSDPSWAVVHDDDASKTTQDLTTPLLAKQEASADSTGADVTANSQSQEVGGGKEVRGDKETTKPENMSKMSFLKVSALAIAGTALYVFWGATFVTVASLTAVAGQTSALLARQVTSYVAGGIGMCVAPVAAVNEYRISKKDSIRTFISILREQVNRLMVENEKFTASVEVLEQKAAQLKGTERKLHNITIRQGRNVDEFVGLVKTNEDNIEKMKISVRSDANNILTKLVLLADRDHSFSFEGSERDLLILRLKEVNFLHWNEKSEQTLRKGMESDPSLGNVLALCKTLVKDYLKEEDLLLSLTDGVDPRTGKKRAGFRKMARMGF
mmetsp:Transcript_41606/g.61034  ORF Transcript_41606/g.61034 Transcript_41606/m.61034 type:complete len:363 (+) Transcript_41606:120-1208(+)|eukprot:CAMPEP_0195512404 /NCGR_PEP_ID=MMETSP0794_2-20130614/4370_1 /TAXON_ID=515487 /ORGANISM="Stephanopyxis turris, Strain CCMP 815" /LENGTH=362 /DNA_ID=CAMNT_0040640177 /DNA_START=112 /DNA_END=1200 /DNA_ORIENTATION=+